MFCQRINDYCVASVEVEQKKKAWSSKIIHGISSASIPLTFEIQSITRNIPLMLADSPHRYTPILGYILKRKNVHGK